MRFIGHESFAKFHDAHRVKWYAVIGKYEFGDPEIAAADNSADRKTLLVWLDDSALLNVVPAADSPTNAAMPLRNEMSTVMLRKLLLAAIAASYCSQSGRAQDETFGERVEHIVAYMTEKAEKCIDPALEGEDPFTVCRGDADTISLTISASLPVRDGDGRVVETCPAMLTATKVPGFSAVKMAPGLATCPGKTIASGEYAQIFVRILLKLGDWVVRMEQPAR